MSPKINNMIHISIKGQWQPSVGVIKIKPNSKKHLKLIHDGFMDIHGNILGTASLYYRKIPQSYEKETILSTL